MRRVAVSIALLAIAAVVVIPMLWVLLTSLKSGPEIFQSPWGLPSQPKWSNYGAAWRDAGIGQFFGNSVLITLATLVVLIPIGAMAAYVFARFPFRGSQSLFGLFMGGMMFPNFLVVVPLFFLLKSMHLLDTKMGLIAVYIAYSLSFTIFVLTGFFQALPKELEEAASLDGCSQSGTFWRVMMPLARPGIVVVGIFNAMGLWNEYGLALVLVSKEENRTLPLGIANLMMTKNYEGDWGALFAGLVIVMAPVLLMYWVFRDKIHETMLAGALKG